MRTIPVQPLRVWLSAAVFIIGAVLFGTFRPLHRLHSQRTGRSGVHQRIPPSEISDSSVDDQRLPVRSGAPANQYVSAASIALLLSIVAMVLSARRTALGSITVRRLKLPRTADSSPSS
ncbi:MAG TPA: hypothetical protein VMW56_22145 [Candidatus Margulisiibacteriota bacterium]|nr:hypothetical protein [Candidatus Margulisiibacteriota bacterium]